jgi:hypothetical protein|uniref:Uncharacterized protein n=1 Tax=viral metagenome TaxID=1070528 RepID=A0A6C0ALB8_9ZZZZ
MDNNNRFAVLKTNTFKCDDSRKSTKETNDRSNDTRKMENNFKNNSSFNRPKMPNNHRNNFMNYTEKKEEKKPEFNFNNDDFPSLG